jgi:hypothetical protein
LFCLRSFTHGNVHSRLFLQPGASIINKTCERIRKILEIIEYIWQTEIFKSVTNSACLL